MSEMMAYRMISLPKQGAYNIRFSLNESKTKFKAPGGNNAEGFPG